MSTKLLSETICRKGLMVKCFVALIVFCCSVGEAFAQTNTKVTINVNNVLIRTAFVQRTGNRILFCDFREKHEG